MRFTTSFDDGKLEIGLEGELDHHAAKEAMAFISREIDMNLPRTYVLNLAKLSFMDSSGIAVILGGHKRIKEIGGSYRVINVKKQPMKVLTAASITRMVEIQPA